MNKKKLRISLASARKNADLTQAEAARRIGITVDTLSNYERGRTFPDVPIIMQIEKVYSVAYSDLIFISKNYDKTVNPM